MDCIRLINEKDYAPLSLFWALDGTYLDTKLLYPAESSYVFERNGEILYAVAVHLIRGLPVAYVEAVVRNPQKQPDFDALKSLQIYLEEQAKTQGYTKLVGIPKNERLCNHYEKLGYNRVASVIYTLKEL